MTDSGCTTSANVYCAQRETRRFLLPANLCDCLLFMRPSLQTVTLSNGVRLSVSPVPAHTPKTEARRNLKFRGTVTPRDYNSVHFFWHKGQVQGHTGPMSFGIGDALLLKSAA